MQKQRISPVVWLSGLVTGACAMMLFVDQGFDVTAEGRLIVARIGIPIGIGIGVVLSLIGKYRE